MADDNHFEKCKMRYLCSHSTISMKFDKMMHLSPLDLIENQKLKNFQNQDGIDGGRLENRKIVISLKLFGRF